MNLNKLTLKTILIFIIILILTAIYLYSVRPIKDQLSSFSTSLGDRTYEQKINISLAAKTIDGTMLQPGDEFFFNRVVGPRTMTRGYMNAKAFMEGELVSSIGGGICQLSSTLYTASLMAGLKIIKRVPHFYTVDSVPPGLDASVWYGKTDLVIANAFSYPVKIYTSTKNNNLKVEIYGIKDRNVKINFSDKKVICPQMKIVYTNDIKRGKRIIQKGRNGCYVKVSRVIYRKNSNFQENISQDYYKPYPGVIYIGK